MYGVDPDFGRKVDIDLSEERMQKAWEAYKIRWEREENDIRELEEKKLVRIYRKTSVSGGTYIFNFYTVNNL